MLTGVMVKWETKCDTSEIASTIAGQLTTMGTRIAVESLQKAFQERADNPNDASNAEREWEWNVMASALFNALHQFDLAMDATRE